MEKTVYIYGLTDPRNNQLRYVGYTDNLKRRLNKHLNDKEVTHKTCWIKSMRADGVLPDVFVIEETSKQECQATERFWIAYFRYVGCDLTNSNDGGNGGLNPSPETREKQRLSHLGKTPSPATRAKVAAKSQGRVLSKRTTSAKGATPMIMGKDGKLTLAPESLAKISAKNKGRKHTPTARAKMSMAKTGRKLSAVTRAKMSAVRTGKKMPPGFGENVSKRMQGNKNGLGVKRSPDVGAKISKALKGKKIALGTRRTPEQRARMSAAQRKRFEKRGDVNAVLSINIVPLFN